MREKLRSGKKAVNNDNNQKCSENTHSTINSLSCCTTSLPIAAASFYRYR